MARLQRGDPDYESAALLRKGLQDLGVHGEELSVDVGRIVC